MSIDSTHERKQAGRFSKIDVPLFGANLGTYDDAVVPPEIVVAPRAYSPDTSDLQDTRELEELDRQADKLGSFALGRERTDLPLPEDDTIATPVVASGTKKKSTIKGREVQPIEGEVDPHWNSQPDPAVDEQPPTSSEDYMTIRKKLHEDALVRRADGDSAILDVLKRLDDERGRKA